MAAIGSVLLAPAASAEPLTCELFRERLNGGLLIVGDPAPEVPVFVQKAGGGGGGKRYSWSTTDLSGTMTCDAAGLFREFYVTLEFNSRDRFAEQLKRLVAMNGAALCSLAADVPAACVDTGKALLQQALQQTGEAYKRKLDHPSSIATLKPVPNVTAEMTAALSLITFSLAVDDGATLDQVRKPFSTPAKATQ
ncbi:hypothetical protein [Lichenifustis flavocetrariae]|uniref:Uncharacterized protein n=1 Tax=Lichenifustis flavocetrariae TaxID=2949735 RepID=A0AA41YZ26_9HYPH|nr:hypothetical protein [Lichenifustis flavocetrariae]MCW6511226.1 hypothetical protein [Lichenifustis flavocetrariae]